MLQPVSNAPHQPTSLQILFKDCKVVRPYRYQYEWKGIRIVTYEGPHEYLLIFRKRKHMFKALSVLHQSASHLEPLFTEVLTAQDGEAQSQNFSKLCQMWQEGAISNGDYLLLLNFEANRSFNDASQYPVFPWVISDFKNETISLADKSHQFRDLSKPVAAIDPTKLEQSRSKYFEMVAKDPKSSPFLR